MKPPPRHQRRRIERELRKLRNSGICSICKHPLAHNTRLSGGLDAQGRIVMAGECCSSQVTETFSLGNFVTRHYDIPTPNSWLTFEQAAAASAAFQQVVARIDKQFADIERRGGGGRATKIYLADYPWKSDDHEWFDRNRERTHRARLAYPGEFDGMGATPAEHELVVLVRQVRPGSRLQAPIFIHTEMLPVPDDDEAAAHALFEMATGREPMPPNFRALVALVEKYKAVREVS
jgi:hypothetical protein